MTVRRLADPAPARWRFRRIAGLRTAPRPARRQAPFPRQGIQRLQVQWRLVTTSYAIVETGGKQYRAEKGTSLVVEHLPADEGAKVSLRAVMYPRRRRGGARGRPAREGEGRGGGRRAPARPEASRLQVQAEEGLPPPRRSPPGADPARGDRREAPDPQAGGEGRGRAGGEGRGEAGGEGRGEAGEAGGQEASGQAKPAARKPAAKKPAARKPAAKKPAAKKPAGSGKAQATRKASTARRSSSAKKES